MSIARRALPQTPLPMTRAAWSALQAEARRGPLDGVHRRDHDLALRLETIDEVLRSGTVVDERGMGAIGRRVTFREEDGARMTVSLVIPGDGDPRQGWISVDAPLGQALLYARAGDTVTVRAPAGERAVLVEAVD